MGCLTHWENYKNVSRTLTLGKQPKSEKVLGLLRMPKEPYLARVEHTIEKNTHTQTGFLKWEKQKQKTSVKSHTEPYLARDKQIQMNTQKNRETGSSAFFLLRLPWTLKQSYLVRDKKKGNRIE